MPKSRVYITLPKDIVDWVDKQVETRRFANRSHAIEIALMKLIETEEKKE